MSESAAPVIGAPARSRNAFLDFVRTVAILRVIAWHTYGYPWISYLIASMPAMFFVAGSLMAQSLDRAGPINVLYRRFRRLLIPLWLFGVVAVTVMLAYDHYSSTAEAHLEPASLWRWAFPIWDAEGSNWGITWWASLWYLRCLVWLLLASPVLLWIWRKAGWAFLVVPLAALVTAEVLDRRGDPIPWQYQDFALYTLFWVLGFAYQDGRFAVLNVYHRLGLCLVFSAGAAGWALTRDVPGDIVNTSYPLHLMVGMAWLMGALAFEGALGRFALRPFAASCIYWVNERALTIYLWHAAGLFVMYQVLWTRDHSEFERKAFALPIVVAVTFLAVLSFGWLEDAAGGRRPRFWPRRGAAAGSRVSVPAFLGVGVPSAIAAGAAIFLVSLAAGNIDPSPAESRETRVHAVPPSGVGLQFRTAMAEILVSPPGERPTSGAVTAVRDNELNAEILAWLERWQLTGVELTILRPNGEGFSGAIGTHADGEPFVLGESYHTASITKTFTAALILQLVEEGKVSLDDPLTRFVPDFPDADRITVRNLIQHTSGLIGTDATDPFVALDQAAYAGLQFEPGQGFTYSSPGYYMLGLIIEQVFSEPYTQVLHERLLDPLGLHSTLMDEEFNPTEYSTHPYAWPYDDIENYHWYSTGLYREVVPDFQYHGVLWSSAGLWSSTEDIARWGLFLWESDRVVSHETQAQMTTFLGPEFQYAGLATYPYCPCWTQDGRIVAERWGHLGLTGALEYDAVDNVALAFDTSGTVVDENVIVALDDLSVRLRELIRGRPMPFLRTLEP